MINQEDLQSITEYLQDINITLQLFYDSTIKINNQLTHSSKTKLNFSSPTHNKASTNSKHTTITSLIISYPPQNNSFKISKPLKTIFIPISNNYNQPSKMSITPSSTNNKLSINSISKPFMNPISSTTIINYPMG